VSACPRGLLFGFAGAAAAALGGRGWWPAVAGEVAVVGLVFDHYGTLLLRREMSVIKSVTSFELARPVEPWVVFARDDAHRAHEQVKVPTPGGVIRRLDSRKMTDVAGLFGEFAEKLEFPSYFGHNWYALVDCLDDLHGSWHGGRPVLVVVEDADELVGKEFFPLFIALLCEAGERANLSLDADGIPRSRPPFPLHFLFFLARREIREVAELLRVRADILIRESDGCLLVWSQSE